MITVQEKETRRKPPKKPSIRWAWKKQDDLYIVYSKEKKDIIGVAPSLRDAKAIFTARFNEFLREWHSEYRIEM